MTTPGDPVARRLSAPLVALIVTAFAIIVPQQSWACSCAALEFSEQVEQAGRIFSGTVVEVSDPSAGSVVRSDDTLTYTITVDQVYKGEASARTTVRSARDSASCGVNLVVGKTYLLLIDPGTSDQVGLCGGSAELATFDAADLALLGPDRSRPLYPRTGRQPVLPRAGRQPVRDPARPSAGAWVPSACSGS